LKIRQKSLPPDHPNLATTYENIKAARVGIDRQTEEIARRSWMRKM